MARTVPLIRTAAIVPWVRWLRNNGRPVEQRLSDAGISFIDLDQPNAPFPLLALVEFIRQQARLEGNDIGCRLVTATSVSDLANLGLVALSARSPKAAFRSVARSLPRHCSHEVITVENRPNHLLICEHWLLEFDAEALHLIQQYVAALLNSICRLAETRDPRPSRISMVPHPVTGLSHLQPWIGDRLEAATRPKLSLLFPADVANAALPARDLASQDTKMLKNDWAKLRERGVLRDSLEVAIAALLPGGAPSVDCLADYAGMSPRTFQRRLADEGTCVSELVDEVRRKAALEALSGGTLTLGALAEKLGYANATALTRAVRRWTGAPPSDFRKSAGRKVPPASDRQVS